MTTPPATEGNSGTALVETKSTKSAEVRQTAKRLLDGISGPMRDPDRLREVRAVELLERIATSEAKSVLRALAKGADARLTREARAALERLEGK